MIHSTMYFIYKSAVQCWEKLCRKKKIKQKKKNNRGQKSVNTVRAIVMFPGAPMQSDFCHRVSSIQIPLSRAFKAIFLLTKKKKKRRAMEELLYLMAKHRTCRTCMLRRQSRTDFPSLPCIQFRTEPHLSENKSRVVSGSSFSPEVWIKCTLSLHLRQIQLDYSMSQH